MAPRTSLVEEVGHGRDEFGRGGPSVQPVHFGPPPSSRSSTSHSVSLTRRPIAASSTDAGLPGQVALGLESADDAPAQRGHGQPPAKRIAVDGRARGLLVGGQKALDAAESACAERLGRAEPPGPDAEPGQVLVDLAGVHQFPVQDGGQPGAVDDQVAHPEVAVHQNPRRRRRPVGGQPAKRPLEGRRGIAHLVEAVAPLAELIGLCQADALGVGAVDGGKRLGALPKQPLATGIVEAARGFV